MLLRISSHSKYWSENVDPVNNTELVYCSIVVLLGGLTQMRLIRLLVYTKYGA